MCGIKVKVLGAGSVGCHLAHAANSLGWDVTIVDPDTTARRRAVVETFPNRYGKWDSKIGLMAEDSPMDRVRWDLVCIGTPPDSHLTLAMEALRAGVKAVLVEKPLAPYLALGGGFLQRLASQQSARVFVGFNHLVSPGVERLGKLLKSGSLGTVKTIDVQWCENWEGIMAAHPWLGSPSDSYLGFFKRGGGALFEHSHGVALWRNIASLAWGSLPRLVSSTASFHSNGGLYDSEVRITFGSSSRIVGSVEQNVVSDPPVKEISVDGTHGSASLAFGAPEGADSLVFRNLDAGFQEEVFPKTRPLEFVRELSHLSSATAGRSSSPLDLRFAREVQLLSNLAMRKALRSEPRGLAQFSFLQEELEGN